MSLKIIWRENMSKIWVMMWFENLGRRDDFLPTSCMPMSKVGNGAPNPLVKVGLAMAGMGSVTNIKGEQFSKGRMGGYGGTFNHNLQQQGHNVRW
jgi:hypothetical protein